MEGELNSLSLLCLKGMASTTQDLKSFSARVWLRTVVSQGRELGAVLLRKVRVARLINDSNTKVSRSLEFTAEYRIKRVTKFLLIIAS